MASTPHSAAEFNRSLRQVAGQGVGVLMATHDIWRAKEVADRVVVMARGRIVLELDPHSIFRRRDRAAILPGGGFEWR